METAVRRPFTLTLTLTKTCPECKQACGALYDPLEDGQAVCLGCALDREAVAEYEAREAAEEWGRAEASWQAATNTLPLYAAHCGGDSETFCSETDARTWADMVGRQGLVVTVARL